MFQKTHISATHPLLVLVLLGFLCCCKAFALWGSQTQGPRTKPSLSDGSSLSDMAALEELSHSVSDREVEAIRLGIANLENYSRRPDCFRQVAGVIQGHCGRLETTEDARINAALSMALCEVTTAKHHSIPLECEPFSPGALSSFDKDSQNPEIQGRCVDALARSPQTWSSYSGYLREIPQLCFAFRRWNDIDTARDIYRNVTSKQLTLYDKTIAIMQGFDQQLRILGDQLINLHEATETSRNIHLPIRSVLEQFQQQVDQLPRVVREMLDRIGKHYDGIETEFLEKAKFAFDHGLTRSRATLTRSVAELTSLLHQHYDAFLTDFAQQRDSVLHLEESMRNSLYALNEQLLLLQEKIENMLIPASQLAQNLDTQVRQYAVLTLAQENATASVAELQDSITSLITTAKHEISTLNGTAVSVIENFGMVNHGYWRWWPEVFGAITSIIWRNKLENLPILQLLEGLLGVVAYLAQSFIQGLFIVLLSRRSLRRSPAENVHSRSRLASRIAPSHRTGLYARSGQGFTRIPRVPYHTGTHWGQ